VVGAVWSGESAETEAAGDVLAVVWLADGSLDSVDASFCAAGVIASGSAFAASAVLAGELGVM